MKKKTLTTALILFAALTFNKISFAQVEIRGARSCGQWIEMRQSRDEMPKLAAEAWLIGYLSGIATGLNKDLLKGTDLASASLWMDNYCRANPLKNIADGGSQLAIELMKQKKL